MQRVAAVGAGPQAGENGGKPSTLHPALAAPGKLPERWMAYRVEHHDSAFFPQFRAVPW
jgi:hypothetical protein